MTISSSQPRNTDSKGRVTLGEQFANRTVLIEDRGDEVVIRLARVIPEREAWLYENKKAMASVRRGLKDAKSGRTAKAPDLAAAKRLVADMDDEG
jgi:hypothetical protein